MTPVTRVLALDVRASRFAFAACEGDRKLLDWGVRSFRKGVNAVTGPVNQKCGALMDYFAPSVIVVKRRDGDTNERRRAMYEAVLLEAAKRRIPVRLLSRKTVNQVFAGSNRNKYAVAQAVAKRFPELAPRLPPPPKIWKSEDYRLSIFDAAALAVAYLTPREPIPQT